MSLLIREVTAVTKWCRLQKSDVFVESFVPPFWALNDFMLSPRDENGLSVYEVEDQNGGLEVACAFGFRNDNFGGQRVFACADKSAIAGLGVTVSETLGGLEHKEVNLWHREIHVETLQTLLLITKQFMLGSFMSFEKKQIRAAGIAAARKNLFSYVELGRLQFQTNMCAKNLVNIFVKDKVVEVRGITE